MQHTTSRRERLLPDVAAAAAGVVVEAGDLSRNTLAVEKDTTAAPPVADAQVASDSTDN